MPRKRQVSQEMSITHTTSHPTVVGTVQVGERAIAAIVARAVAETDDVVGLVAPDAPPHAPVLDARAARRGMVIRQHDGVVIVEVFAILVYGVAIARVAEELERQITHQLEFALGAPIRVHVRLKGLRRVQVSPAE